MKDQINRSKESFDKIVEKAKKSKFYPKVSKVAPYVATAGVSYIAGSVIEKADTTADLAAYFGESKSTISNFLSMIDNLS